MQEVTTEDVGAIPELNGYAGDIITHSLKIKGFSFCPFDLAADIYGPCGNGCIYCYTKNFRNNTTVYHQNNRQFTEKKLIKDFKDAMVNDYHPAYFHVRHRIPVELSITTDPFQYKLETEQGASLRFLKFLNKIKYPVAVCTKSVDTFSRPEYWDAVMDLHKDKNIFFKISLCTLDDEVGKVIEPGAPLPSERLAFIKRLSKAGVGVIVRSEPHIMGHSLCSYTKHIKKLKQTGVQRVICEVLQLNNRFHQESCKPIFTAVGTTSREYFAKYGEGFVTPSGWIPYDPDEVRQEMIGMKTLLNNNGIKFGAHGAHYGLMNIDLSDMKHYCCELDGYEHIAHDNDSVAVRYAEGRMDEITIPLRDRSRYWEEMQRVELVNNPTLKLFWKGGIPK